MKTIKILLVSVLLATSAFAWGKNEQNALLGFGAGVLVSHMIGDAHVHHDTRVSYSDRMDYRPRPVVYREEHHRVVHHHAPRYRDDHRGRHCHKRYAHDNRRHHKHHRHPHRKHHRDTVAVNQYNSYYY